jgi:hypothetical protein
MMGIDSDDEGASVGKKVGDIWGLKIYRDPDARPLRKQVGPGV